MSDLIDRAAVLKNIEKIRHGVRMMNDAHRASIIMNGMYLCEKAVRKQPSIEQEDCSTCKYGHFGDRKCDYCRVAYPSHYERDENE